MNGHTSAVLEHIEGQLTAILEGQAPMASVPGDIAVLKSDMAEVKADIRTIKTVITDQSKMLNGHERKLARFK
jgi:hypothetical protein